MDSQRKQAEAAAREIVRTHPELVRPGGASKGIADIILRHMRPQWIPVGERLPEHGQQVLTYIPESADRQEMYRLQTAGSSGTSRLLPSVTHWQELQPPQPEPALATVRVKFRDVGQLPPMDMSDESDGEE